MPIRCFVRILALSSAVALAQPAGAAGQVTAVAAGVDFSIALTAPGTVTCPDGTVAASGDQCDADTVSFANGRVLTIVTRLVGGDDATTSMLAEAAAWSMSGSLAIAGPLSALGRFIDIPTNTIAAPDPEAVALNTGKESIDSCFFCP